MEKITQDFKDGTADGLLHGQTREQNQSSAYKQGYDFGLYLWNELEVMKQDKEGA